MIRALLLLLLCLMPVAGHAEWREASSKHFLVYSEGSEASLRNAIIRLEKFDYLLRNFAGREDVAEPVKIKVYMVPDIGTVQDLYPGSVDGVAGYYSGDVRGPITVVPREDFGGNLGMQAREVLYHELAHHFMLQYFPGTYPAWYVEGFADYYGTIDIDANNNDITLGRPNNSRYFSLRGTDWLPVETLLTATNYDDVGDRLHLLYAEGWLLVHYLGNTPERSGQLEKYLNGIAKGQTYTEAARAAFGDLDKLNSELRRYSKYNRLPALKIALKPVDLGPITVRTLSPAEDALIKHDIRIGTGIFKADIADFAAEVEAIAARYPGDPYALRLTTEAQRLAGRTDAALQSVDRWLAAKPGDPVALAFKGLLQTDKLRAAKSTDEDAWNDARAFVADAMRKAPRNPQILKAYYDSFAAQGVLPPASAQNALVTALDIVPQDDSLRHQVAADFEKRGFIEDAIFIIRPLAFATSQSKGESPEEKMKREREEERERMAGQQKRENAREMLARLEAKQKEARSAAAD